MSCQRGSCSNVGAVPRTNSDDATSRNNDGNNRWMPRNSEGTGTNQRNCTCASNCTGTCNREAGYGGRCQADCSCGHNCAGCGGCSGGCSGCSGDCDGCSGACGGSCSGTCSNGCSYTCSGSCKGYCKGTCNDGCQGGCKTACSGSCQHLCNETCRSDAALEAYKHLNKYTIVDNTNHSFEEHFNNDAIILDWLDADDMQHLFKMIQEEGRRRVLKKTGTYQGDKDHPKTIAQTLTRAEEYQIGLVDETGKKIEVQRGQLADDEKHIKKLLNLYAENTGKSISIGVGGASIAEGKTITKAIGKTLIEKAISAYEEKIPINTTSEGSGKQTIEDGK